MRMADDFPFLLQHGIFFVDTCVLNLSPHESISFSSSMPRKRICTVDSLEEATFRLKFLTKKLSGMKNWLTIEEVIEEIEYGTEQLMLVQDGCGYQQKKAAYGTLINQRKETTELLKQDHVNATTNLTDKLVKKVSQSLQIVEEHFYDWGGKTNQWNTDCKLIATALVYAEDSIVGMYSHDRPLLCTFAYCSTFLDLPVETTYISDEKTGKLRPSFAFLRNHTHYLNNEDKKGPLMTFLKRPYKYFNRGSKRAPLFHP
jgi:hypothetical protein